MASASQKFGEHVRELFVSYYVFPEILQRQRNGTAQRPFPLHAAQILFPFGSAQPVIRLNDEVRTIAQVKLKPGIGKRAGDPVYAQEIESLEGAEPPADDAGSQHVTILLLNGVWTVAFGFSFNLQLVMEHLAAADQFLQCARDATVRDHRRAAWYNLFCATELIAKATFMVLPNAGAMEFNHGPLKQHYNLFSHSGASLTKYSSTLNRLSRLRKQARYLSADFQVTPDELSNLLGSVEDMRREVEERTRP